MQCRLRASIAAAVSVPCAAVLLVGCGGGGSSTPSGSASKSTVSSANPAPDGPIVIGAIGSYTATTGGSVGSDPGAAKAIAAWADYTNANGGLLGRQVKVIVKDDHGDAVIAMAAAKELVETDHVAAIVADQSDVDQAWQKYIDGKGVPVVGGRPDNISFVTDANFFPSGANLIALTYATQLAAKTKGINLGSVVCAESEQCVFQAQVQREVARATGMKVAVDDTVALDRSDFTLLCQKLTTTNVQTYQIAASSATVISLSTACAAQGLTASVVTTGTSLDATWLPVPALQGTFAAQADAPWFDTTIPGVATYRKAVTDYVPGGLGAFDGPRAWGAWVAGQLLAKAVLAAESAAVTPASVRKGLYALRGETLDGAVAPITYRSGLPTLLNCYFRVAIVGGAFTTSQGNSPVCAPDAIVTAVLDKLRP